MCYSLTQTTVLDADMFVLDPPSNITPAQADLITQQSIQDTHVLIGWQVRFLVWRRACVLYVCIVCARRANLCGYAPKIRRVANSTSLCLSLSLLSFCFSLFLPLSIFLSPLQLITVTVTPALFCLSVCLPVGLSVCLPACLSICLSACLSVCLSICLPCCLSV